MSKETMKLVPVEPTPEMLKAMDECSKEGYDERLYAGHAASVYMAAIDAAPEQPAQQTAAIKTLEFLGYTYHGGKQWKPPLGNRPEWIDEKAQQEPVAWIVEDQSGERLEWASDAHSCHGVPTFPLYTSPPAQRTWVGLVWGELPEDGHDHDFLRGATWAEAKLKEKNT